MKTLLISIRFLIVVAVITGILYPLSVFLAGNFFFKHQAQGSLLYNHKQEVIGSELIGQKFTDERYFWPRPSMAGEGYDSMQSSGSNLPISSEKLKEKVVKNYYKLRNQNPNGEVPVELITYSASGIDPHISVEGAYFQIPRIAKQRGINPQELVELINQNIETPFLRIFGTYKVNVLKLNLELDNKFNNG